jgi:uncharacterized membrane protein
MRSQSGKTEKAAIQLSLMAVMSALVTGATFFVRIPNPMGGYFNFGDVAIFAVALTFNPLIGGVAAGIGSAISDAIGFPVFALPTLIIKGVEGALAGVICDRRRVLRDIIAVAVAGCEMVAGYFLVELFVLQWGLAGALAEIPTNVAQIVIGAVVGIPVAYVVRRRVPDLLK